MQTLNLLAFKALNNYLEQRKEGIDPVFKAKDIELPHDVDYWN